MDNLADQVGTFFQEFEFTHLKQLWVEHLIELGIDKKEASVWAAEIGHVVDEYRRTLVSLTNLMTESNAERIPRRVHSWAVGIIVNTVDDIEEPMKYLEKQLEKYLPPEEDEDDD